MIDGLPASYDQWRTSNREDEDELREKRRLREEYLAEKADDMRDRERDEPTYRDFGNE